MNKFIILSALVAFALSPAFASGDILAKSDTARIINSVLNGDERNRNYDRYDYNSNRNYNRYDRDKKRYQNNRKYNNRNYNSKRRYR